MSTKQTNGDAYQVIDTAIEQIESSLDALETVVTNEDHTDEWIALSDSIANFVESYSEFKRNRQ